MVFFLPKFIVYDEQLSIEDKLMSGILGGSFGFGFGFGFVSGGQPWNGLGS